MDHPDGVVHVRAADAVVELRVQRRRMEECVDRAIRASQSAFTDAENVQRAGAQRGPLPYALGGLSDPRDRLVDAAALVEVEQRQLDVTCSVEMRPRRLEIRPSIGVTAERVTHAATPV